MSTWYIEERLRHLDPQTYIRERDEYSDGKRWGVVSRVMLSSEGVGARSFAAYGVTQEEAWLAAWEVVLEYSKAPKFLIRHNCVSGVYLYDQELAQVWVRWNRGRWEDVPATDDMLRAWKIPLDLIRSIAVQNVFDRQQVN